MSTFCSPRGTFVFIFYLIRIACSGNVLFCEMHNLECNGLPKQIHNWTKPKVGDFERNMRNPKKKNDDTFDAFDADFVMRMYYCVMLLIVHKVTWNQWIRFRGRFRDREIGRFHDREIGRFRDREIGRFRDREIGRFHDSGIGRFRGREIGREILSTDSKSLCGQSAASHNNTCASRNQHQMRQMCHHFFGFLMLLLLSLMRELLWTGELSTAEFGLRKCPLGSQVY